MNLKCEHCIYISSFPHFGCDNGRLEFYDQSSVVECPEKRVLEIVYSDETIEGEKIK